VKLILESWRQYLTEDLLTEFDRSDKEALMDEQGRFTISYEIELESRDDVGDKPGGRAEYARNYLTFDYFADSWNEREASDFWHGYLDEENPEAWELVNKYLLEEYDDTDANLTELILFAIGVKDNEQNEKEFNTLYNNIIKEGSRENKAFIEMLQGDPDIVEDLKSRGVTLQTARQRTLPLGDDTPEEETVALGLQPDVVEDLVKSYLFDPNKNFIPNQWVADKTLDLETFLGRAGWGEEASDWRDHGSEQIKTFIIDGGANYPTVGHLTYFNFGREEEGTQWKSYYLKEIAKMVAEASTKFVEERSQADWDEYQSDPEDYLDNIGYEWEESYEGDKDGDLYKLMEEHFPRFMEKWADQLKFEPDGSLRNGIEFSMDDPKFMTGLDTAFEFLKDFFFDYNRQDNFQFDVNTGLHTNIGYLDDDGESHKDYNLMKALLFLNHDFAFKEFGQRKGTQWATDLKSDIVEKIEKAFKQDRTRFKDLAMKLYKEDKLDELGRELSRFVDNYAPSNPKSLGFNIHYIDRLGYVEFRYPGGKGPTLEKMKNATLYYAYVIKQAVDADYKKKEYQSKLVKLMTNLAGHVDRPTEVKKIKEFMKKGEVYLIPTKTISELAGVDVRARSTTAINSYIQHVLGHSLPWSMYATEAGLFKGIRKGKTLKDTLAIFKVVEGSSASFDDPIAAAANGANYKIGERTIPLPELERMITNESLHFVNSNSTEERIRDIFNLVAGGSKVRSKPPAKKKKREEKPPWIAENKTKIKVRLLK